MKQTKLIYLISLLILSLMMIIGCSDNTKVTIDNNPKVTPEETVAPEQTTAPIPTEMPTVEPTAIQTEIPPTPTETATAEPTAEQTTIPTATPEITDLEGLTCKADTSRKITCDIKIDNSVIPATYTRLDYVYRIYTQEEGNERWRFVKDIVAKKGDSKTKETVSIGCDVGGSNCLNPNTNYKIRVRAEGRELSTISGQMYKYTEFEDYKYSTVKTEDGIKLGTKTNISCVYTDKSTLEKTLSWLPNEKAKEYRVITNSFNINKYNTTTETSMKFKGFQDIFYVGLVDKWDYVEYTELKEDNCN